MNYKFKHLKVFGSVENLFGNEKKYRRVFDELECKYLYAEFAFYNKLFDEGDWDVNIRLVCKNVDTDKQICELKKAYKAVGAVYKDLNHGDLRSQELEGTNATSPVATPKKNKYGV